MDENEKIGKRLRGLGFYRDTLKGGWRREYTKRPNTKRNFVEDWLIVRHVRGTFYLTQATSLSKVDFDAKFNKDYKHIKIPVQFERGEYTDIESLVTALEQLIREEKGKIR